MAISRRSGLETLLKTKGFLIILKQCYLSGIIEECELKIDRGRGKIEAVDISNQIILATEQKIIGNRKFKITIGLSDLELLFKFVQSLDSESEEVKIKFGNRYMILKAKRRSLDYILTDPDLIMTKPEHEGKESPQDKIFSLMRYSASLSSSIIKDFLSYISLLKTKDTMIVLKKRNISFICGSDLEHQITLELDNKTNKNVDKSFRVKINGEHLAKIFQTIDYDSDEPPEIHLAKNKPVMIICGRASWSLVPLSDEEGEENE